MKKFLSVLLVFSLILSISLFSCENKPDDQKDDGDEKELTAEEKAIMDDVIFLMEDDTYDPNELIGKFFGDFSIESFGSADLPYSKIYKIGDVLAVDYKNSSDTSYQIVKDSKLCTVYRTSDGTKIHLESEQEYPYDYPLSVFTAFGIDMSSVYSPNEAAEDEPEVTYDSLTVSEDKKSVKFSKDYLKDVARYLCKSFEADDKEIDKFVKDMSASGVYTLDDRTVNFTIKGNIESIGDVEIKTSAAYSGDNEPSLISTSITITTEVNGAPVTTTQEQDISCNEYQNGELSKVSVSTRTIVKTEVTQNGVTIDVMNVTNGNYTFALTDSLPFYASIDVKAEQIMTYAGQSQRSNSSVSLSLRDKNFTYRTSVNGIQQSYIEAEVVSFRAPENTAIPDDIYTVLPK